MTARISLRTQPATRARRGQPPVVPPPPVARVVLLPHAGGTAAFFRTWGPALPDWHVVAAQYPGREDLLSEAPYRRLDVMADDVATQLAPLLADGVPTVVFGHSLGAALAHEVAVRLVSAGTPPAALVVSAAPGPSAVRGGRRLHAATDAALISFLTDQGGTPEELLRYPDWMDMVLRILRADLEVLETHRPRPDAVVPVPLLALGGDTDAAATPTDLDAWAAITTAAFTRAQFRGGHFYLEAERDAVVARVRALVEAGTPAR